jgi:hypothetical protein
MTDMQIGFVTTMGWCEFCRLKLEGLPPGGYTATQKVHVGENHQLTVVITPHSPHCYWAGP